MNGDEKAWFEPKRYGYGTGLPISWEGWLLSAIYLGTVIGSALFIAVRNPVLFMAITVVSSIIFGAILSKRTRGGWRWRWGDKD